MWRFQYNTPKYCKSNSEGSTSIMGFFNKYKEYEDTNLHFRHKRLMKHGILKAMFKAMPTGKKQKIVMS